MRGGMAMFGRKRKPRAEDPSSAPCSCELCQAAARRAMQGAEVLQRVRPSANSLSTPKIPKADRAIGAFADAGSDARPKTGGMLRRRAESNLIIVAPDDTDMPRPKGSCDRREVVIPKPVASARELLRSGRCSADDQSASGDAAAEDDDGGDDHCDGEGDNEEVDDTSGEDIRPSEKGIEIADYEAGFDEADEEHRDGDDDVASEAGSSDQGTAGLNGDDESAEDEQQEAAGSVLQASVERDSPLVLVDVRRRQQFMAIGTCPNPFPRAQPHTTENDEGCGGEEWLACPLANHWFAVEQALPGDEQSWPAWGPAAERLLWTIHTFVIANRSSRVVVTEARSDPSAISAIMKQRKLSVAKLAEQMGRSDAYLYKVFQGRKPLSSELRRQIEAVLNRATPDSGTSGLFTGPRPTPENAARHHALAYHANGWNVIPM